MKEDLKLFNELVDELLKEEKEHPVAPYIPSSELYDKLDFSLSEEGIDEKTFKESLRDLVLKTPRTASNAFFNQLYGGRKSKSILGDLLSVVLNNSMYTYKVAGAQVGVEKTLIHQLCQLIGYGENSDGAMAPGGSMCNMIAMIMARDAADEKIIQEGISQKLTMYTSVESHYSLVKNASFIGIGKDQIRFINTDDQGKMLSSHLEELIQKDLANGFTPFFINATAGTTVLGAYDPITACSEIAKKYNVWLHVDGAYGGGVFFSDRYNYLIEGLEKSDSFNFNAHKMLNTSLTCSFLLTKHKERLYESFTYEADYLYQTDADGFDLGKTSLQCGRKNDALKLWTLWKFVGTNGIKAIINKQFELAKIAKEYIRKNPDYTLYDHGDSLSICFNYKGLDPKFLCKKLYENAVLMVGYGRFRDLSFIRFVSINSENSPEDILLFFKKLEEFVAANEASLLPLKEAVSK